jgi:uncharacterized phage protein gp47/JayE
MDASVLTIYREPRTGSDAESFVTDYTPANHIVEIVGETSGMSVIYSQGQDYELQIDGMVNWLAAGIKPDTGSIYYVSYTYAPTHQVLMEKIFTQIRAVNPEINTLPGSPIHTFIAAFAQSLEDNYHLLIYMQSIAYLDTATGAFLDEVVAILGTERKDAIAATGEVTFSRNEAVDYNAGIPVGTQVATMPTEVAESTYYATNADATLLAGNTSVTVPVHCLSLGSGGNAGVGTVIKLVDMISGINSVTNAEAITGGTDDEADDGLRQRAKDQLSVLGKGTRGAVKRLCESIDGIRQAVVNDKNDDAGIPAGQCNIMLIGNGLLTEESEAFIAAKALIMAEENKPAGPYLVFSIPSIIYCNIDIDIDITLVPGGDATAIFSKAQQNIIAYINGGYTSAGRYYDPLSVGATLTRNQIVAKILDVEGVEEVDSDSMVLMKQVMDEALVYDGANDDELSVTSDEPHNVDSPPDIVSVVGTDVGGGGEDYTFTKDTDYELYETIVSETNMLAVRWLGTTHHPDTSATYHVTYLVNENHDIEATETQLLAAGAITLNEAT